MKKPIIFLILFIRSTQMILAANEENESSDSDSSISSTFSNSSNSPKSQFAEPFNRATEHLKNTLITRNLSALKRLKNVKKAIRDGACVNNDDITDFKNSPLELALQLPADELVYEIVLALLNAKANVNAKYKVGEIIYTPLTLSIVSLFSYSPTMNSPKKLKIIKLLLQKGANANLIFMYDKITPLIYAIPKSELVKLLLDYGAKPSIGMDGWGNKFEDIIKKKEYAESEKIYMKWLKKEKESEIEYKESAEYLEYLEWLKDSEDCSCTVL